MFLWSHSIRFFNKLLFSKQKIIICNFNKVKVLLLYLVILLLFVILVYYELKFIDISLNYTIYVDTLFIHYLKLVLFFSINYKYLDSK